MSEWVASTRVWQRPNPELAQTLVAPARSLAKAGSAAADQHELAHLRRQVRCLQASLSQGQAGPTAGLASQPVTLRGSDFANHELRDGLSEPSRRSQLNALLKQLDGPTVVLAGVEHNIARVRCGAFEAAESAPGKQVGGVWLLVGPRGMVVAKSDVAGSKAPAPTRYGGAGQRSLNEVRTRVNAFARLHPTAQLFAADGVLQVPCLAFLGAPAIFYGRRGLTFRGAQIGDLGALDPKRPGFRPRHGPVE